MIGGVLRVLASVLARVAIVTRGHEHRVVVQHHEAATGVTVMAYLQCGHRLWIRHCHAVEVVLVEQLPRVRARPRR